MEEERPYSELEPSELNAQLHRLFESMPAIQISMAGTLMDRASLDSAEMTDDERAYYLGILQSLKNPDQGSLFGHNPYEGMTISQIEADLNEDTREIFIQQAKGSAAQARRMTYGATLLVKLEEFMPFVQGTDSFKEYMRREIRRCIRDGVGDGGRDHWLYGNDDRGGLFFLDPEGKMEERAFQIFSQDIEWYGIDPMMIIGRIFPADYDNDPNYHSMVDLGRRWKPEFIERYKRAPIDVYAGEIQIP